MYISVALLQNGEVYTFGSNQYGQLGLGDTITRSVSSTMYRLTVNVNIKSQLTLYR